MKENNLIASVALFSELYNSKNRGISDVLSEFITGAVKLKSEYSVDSNRLKFLLEDVYGFQIPESVIRTTMKRMIASNKNINLTNKIYHFNINFNDDNDIYKEFEEKNQLYENIFESLCVYISDKTKKEINPERKEVIFDRFVHYLMGQNGLNDTYYEYISSFIITKSVDPDFHSLLSSIKEGIILHQGIKYTADINNLGSWRDDLTIFLSPEHLFNALGFNGLLYEEIFNDFLKLVNEINSNRKYSHNKRRDKIKLRFLDETQKEIDDFFYIAELIVKGSIALDPSRPAMKEITKGCRKPDDIQLKKIKFFKELKEKGIKQFDYNYSGQQDKYNIEDQNIIDYLERQFTSNGGQFDSDYCYTILSIFTKINTLRKGQNKNRFNQIGYVYMTENNLVKYFANNNAIKSSTNAIPFAYDADFIITQFWYTLKKGFSEEQSIPKSFEFATKAKIVLSSRLNLSVSKKYDKLQLQFKNGEITEDEALNYSYELRNIPNVPEDINSDTIDNSLSFLNDDNFYDNIYRERESESRKIQDLTKRNKELELENAELEVTKTKLKAYEEHEKEEKRNKKLKEFNIKAEEYAIKQWEQKWITLKKDFYYLIKVFIPEYIFTLVLVMVKFELPIISQFLDLFKSKYSKLVVILIIALIIVFDIYTKKYYVNSSRMRKGGLFIKSLFRKKKLRIDSIEDFKNQFIEDNIDEFYLIRQNV